MSQNTGRAPARAIVPAVAKNVKGLVMTASPGPISSAIKAPARLSELARLTQYPEGARRDPINRRHLLARCRLKSRQTQRNPAQGVRPLSSTPTVSPRDSSQLSTLQVYRGLAATLVVLHHASRIVPVYFGGTTSPILSFFAFGKAGVQFFFVLSGFIIYYSHRGDIGSPSKVVPYITKRLIRIYPVYILTTLLLAPFWLLVPGHGEPYHQDLSALILSLLLFPQSHLPHLDVAWTLIHEMIFYMVFSTLILSRPLGTAGLVAWFAAILVVNYDTGAELPFRAAYFFSANNLLFGFGMLAALLTEKFKGGSASGVAFFVLGNVGFVGVGLLANSIGQATSIEFSALILAFGAASFLVVLQARNAILEGIAARRRGLLLLGNSSYSIYLIHHPALALCCKLMRRAGAHWPSYVSFLLISLFAVLCGIALHICVEKPMLGLLRKRLLPRTHS